MKKIGIWVEHPLQLYSAKPVFEKYSNKGELVYLITSIDDIEICKNYLNIEEDKIVLLDQMKNKYDALLVLIFEIIFVPRNFSMVYKDKIFRNESRKLRILRKLFVLKLKKHHVNKFFIKYKSFIEFFKGKSIFPVDLDLIVSFTKIYHVFSLPSEIPHISIMESWDHPIKLPYFIKPDFSLTWNKDLKEDTVFYQNLKRVGQICPLKFRYIYERMNLDDVKIYDEINKKSYINELKKLEDKKIILYPTTTSSLGIGHEGELKLIDDFCRVIEGTQYYLYIKPKPNGPQGEYNVFKKYSNAIVGIYSSNSDSRDMLDEDYHSFRYLLLNRSELVINAGTTFVLEAALMDRKILQLKLEGNYFGKFTAYSNNLHLTKYILNNPFVHIYKGNLETLKDAIKHADYKFKNYIKPWITSW